MKFSFTVTGMGLLSTLFFFLSATKQIHSQGLVAIYDCGLDSSRYFKGSNQGLQKVLCKFNPSQPPAADCKEDEKAKYYNRESCETLLQTYDCSQMATPTRHCWSIGQLTQQGCSLSNEPLDSNTVQCPGPCKMYQCGPEQKSLCYSTKAKPKDTSCVPAADTECTTHFECDALTDRQGVL